MIASVWTRAHAASRQLSSEARAAKALPPDTTDDSLDTRAARIAALHEALEDDRLELRRLASDDPVEASAFARAEAARIGLRIRLLMQRVPRAPDERIREAAVEAMADLRLLAHYVLGITVSRRVFRSLADYEATLVAWERHVRAVRAATSDLTSPPPPSMMELLFFPVDITGFPALGGWFETMLVTALAAGVLMGEDGAARRLSRLLKGLV